MRIQDRIKIFLVAVLLFAGGAIGVQARTITSSLVTTSTKSIVTTAFFGGQIINGNVCPAHCPGSKNYAQTIFIDGANQGTTSIACSPVNPFNNGCGVFIMKETVYNCTYTTSVKTWGGCSANGIQYATSYNYNTVAGNSCSDQAPSSQRCTPSCTISSWTPSPTTVCIGTNFTQTSNCGTTRSNINGTKSCPPPACTVSSWTPDATTICSGTTFTQTSNCGTTRSNINGTKPCPPPACAPNNCAQNTCTGSTCWNGCATVNGNKSCPPPCVPSNPNCVQDTCIDGSCWNGCAPVSGIKDCRDLNWRETSPN